MKVLIAEDERVTAQALGVMVERHPGCTVSGIASNKAVALNGL